MKMKKFLKPVLEFLGVMVLITIFIKVGDVFAQFVPITPDPYLEADIPAPPQKPGQEIVVDLVLGALSYVKTLTVVIGILFITILGAKLVFSSGNEEEVTKAKNGIIYAILAFVMISMSQDVAKIFDMGDKTLLESPQEILNRVHLFDKQVEIFMVFVKYVIGSLATVMLVVAGIKMVTAGGNEEEVSKAKKNALYSGGGLALIYVGQIFIEKVFYKVDKQVYSGITGVHPGVDAKEGVEQIVGITNLVVSFAGPIAVLMLIVGAVMYATAGGEEENMNKAKRLILATVIGIIIIYGAFALVSTVLSSSLTEIGTIIE